MVARVHWWLLRHNGDWQLGRGEEEEEVFSGRCNPQSKLIGLTD